MKIPTPNSPSRRFEVQIKEKMKGKSYQWKGTGKYFPSLSSAIDYVESLPYEERFGKSLRIEEVKV